MKVNEILSENLPQTGANSGGSAQPNLSAAQHMSKSVQEFMKTPEYHKLAAADPKFAKRLAIAWDGDVEHALKDGKNGNYVVPRLLSDPGVLGMTKLDPVALRPVIQAILYSHGLAVRDASKSHLNPKDLWGTERAIREGEASFDDLLAEIKVELAALEL